MDIRQYKQLANLIRDNDIYKVYDLTTLQDLNISLTELNPNKSTTGHSHDATDEVFIFIDGEGIIETGEQILNVGSGDLILVSREDFHRVHNKTEKILSFWTIFEKYEGRGKN